MKDKLFKIWIIVLLILFILGYFGGFENLSNVLSKLFIYVLLLIIWIVTMYKFIMNGIKTFKKQYLDEIINIVFFSLFIIFLLNFVFSFFGVENNSESFNKDNIGLLIFSSLIYAPIVEELIFRCSLDYLLKNYINNDKKIIIISSVVFSFGHVYKMNIGIEGIILYFCIYFVLGFACGFSYKKMNNILCPCLVHFIWNLFMIIGSLIRIIL